MTESMAHSLLMVATVPAQAQPQGGGMGSTLILMVLILGIFYFLLIRPQQKQAREHQTLLGSLKKDDKVVTASGVHGTIWAVKDDTVMLEVARDIRIEVDKASVRKRLGGERTDPATEKARKDRKG